MVLVLEIISVNGIPLRNRSFSSCCGPIQGPVTYHFGSNWKDHWDVWWKEEGIPNEEQEIYHPAQVRDIPSEGLLRITAQANIHEDEDDVAAPIKKHIMPYKSGKISSKDSFMYGSFEIRAKVPLGSGAWPAIWTLPDDSRDFNGTIPWPQGGNMDIMEGVTKDSWKEPDIQKREAVLFSANQWKEAQGRAFCPNSDGNQHCNYNGTIPVKVSEYNSQWLVYHLEWKPNELRYWIDGLSSWENPHLHVQDGDTEQFPPVAQRLIMNLAIGGTRGGDHIDTEMFPIHMDVEYFKYVPFF
eukprot:Nk52_evm65s343 gene=Nk52_evmTU65s343